MISETKINKMFGLVRVDRESLHAALRKVGKAISFSPEDWRVDRPTIGCCSAVSAMVYCYHPIDKNIVPIHLKAEGGSHWVLGLPIEENDAGRARSEGFVVASIGIGKGERKSHIIIDLTADQTDMDFDYDSGKRAVFMCSPSKTPAPSKKTQILAMAFGYNPEKYNRVGNKKTW